VRGEDVKAAVGAEAVEIAAATTESKGNVWVARVDRETRAEEGRPVDLALDTSRLHFFDPATGEAIY
jgi:multiple sugar transport system ATP-binding protein